MGIVGLSLCLIVGTAIHEIAHFLTILYLSAKNVGIKKALRYITTKIIFCMKIGTPVVSIYLNGKKMELVYCLG